MHEIGHTRVFLITGLGVDDAPHLPDVFNRLVHRVVPGADGEANGTHNAPRGAWEVGQNPNVNRAGAGRRGNRTKGEPRRLAWRPSRSRSAPKTKLKPKPKRAGRKKGKERKWGGKGEVGKGGGWGASGGMGQERTERGRRQRKEAEGGEDKQIPGAGAPQGRR